VAAWLSRAWPQSEVVDRRQTPSFGYRAVHIVVWDDGFPIEIQVRTRFQHAWANATEDLADRWGRGIRYGRDPDGVNQIQVAQRAEQLAHWLSVADGLASIEAHIDEKLRNAAQLVEDAKQDDVDKGVLAIQGETLKATFPRELRRLRMSIRRHTQALEPEVAELLSDHLNRLSYMVEL
jgi:ppGpp synthetase/RelA/SpoT-type nucleotidyltranferase